jgi:hypothetical protein
VQLAHNSRFFVESTVDELRQALQNVRDATALAVLRQRFQRSESNILRMAAQDGVTPSIPSLLHRG